MLRLDRRRKGETHPARKSVTEDRVFLFFFYCSRWTFSIPDRIVKRTRILAESDIDGTLDTDIGSNKKDIYNKERIDGKDIKSQRVYIRI